ncbi:hypothetical protein, partial [Escherichia coli]|uniref:hypothetical protein n=1 Tax=Escherichia coli TaxID=562 RepID=UPI003D9C8782
PTLPPRLGRERNGHGAPAISNCSSTPSARPAPSCRRKSSSNWTSASAASARFKFRDRIDGKPVFLYVAPETLQGYPHRRYLEDILGCAETVRYFTLYALRRLIEAPSGKSY